MKKLFFLTIIIFAFGCSKDESKPTDKVDDVNELIGTWKATKWEEIYQNANGTPFRNNWIEEDDVETDIRFNLLITDKVLRYSGEDVEDYRKKDLSYVRNKGYLDVTIDGKKVRVDYELKGNTLKMTQTETNYVWEEGIIIPKVIMTETLEKQK